MISVENGSETVHSVCVDPLNGPDLLKVGAYPDDIKRAHFAYGSLIISTVTDVVGRHCFRLRVTVLGKTCTEQVSPKASGFMFDTMAKFESLMYLRDEDTVEY